MKRTQSLFGRLSNFDWCFLVFKFSLGLVWPLSFWEGEPARNLIQDGFTVFWMLACFGGFIISAIGLIMAKSDHPYWLSKGMRIELSGLYLFLAGPACYGVINLVMFFSRGLEYDNLAQFCLALACSAAIMGRAYLVKETADKK
jgi:hypothetical protein